METENLKQSLDPFRKIPKLELHAHLNGSLSSATLQKLQNLKNKLGCDGSQNFNSENFLSKNLSNCFELFDVIHKMTDTLEGIYMATCDVIKDFYDDGVYYLELRTTPKVVDNNMTQDSYVETVIKAINTTISDLNEKMNVKLILSVDRKRPVCYAQETLKIAEKYYISSQTVVGIDLSGDPKVGNINEFIPYLEQAKKIGLKLAFHVAEVPDAGEEVTKLLNLQPHRLGHGTFLHPSKGGSVENFSTLNESKIPLEICLTSNVVSKTVPSYEEHHFQLFRNIKYPCVLCTDDKGIFNTSLSKEYFLASQYYSLSEVDLYNLSFDSIDYIFSSETDKHELRQQWMSKRNKDTLEYAVEEK